MAELDKNPFEKMEKEAGEMAITRKDVEKDGWMRPEFSYAPAKEN